MNPTVRNLMKIGGLNQCKVVAGINGLDREVNYATIMEVPDIVNWLKGKEVLITSLYPIKDDIIAQENLIRQLHEVGISALAIKPYRFVEEIPKVLIDEANKYNIPIIEIPESISYLDILVPVMNNIFDNKVVLQQDLEQVHKILNEISLSSNGIDHFIETLSYLTKNAITIESQLSYITVPQSNFTFKKLQTNQKKELTIIKRPIRLKRKIEDKEIECIVAPIFLDNKMYGNITSWGINFDHLEIDLAILEKATTLLSLEFLKLKVKYDVEQQYKNDFIRDLLLNNNMTVEEILQRGAKFNFSLKRTYVCLAFQLRGKQINRNEQYEVMNQIEKNIYSIEDKTIVGNIQDLLCIIYPIEVYVDNNIRSKVEKFYETLQNSLFPKIEFSIGVGGYYSGVDGLRKSFNEAEKALYLARKQRDYKNIIHYSDLGVYSLLGQIKEISVLKSFYDETIGKLANYDSNNDSELVMTLSSYFDHNEKLSQTAQSLFIHDNTLKYRLKRIEKLTNYDLQKSEDKLILHLGLRIFDLMSGDYRVG